MTISALIVDDNADNIEALSLLLKKEGVLSRAVRSAREVWAMLDEMNNIDIIFLDLEMPNHNGFQLISQLQADPRFQSTPFVAYTVHISEQNEAYDAGFHSFLGKPLSVERFPHQLQRILSGERVWEIG